MDSCRPLFTYRDMGYTQQAIYCFRKVLVIDPYDMDALWDRSYLLKVSGDLRRVWGILNMLFVTLTNADLSGSRRLP